MSSTCCVGTEVNRCAQSDIYSKGGDRPVSVTLWSKSPNESFNILTGGSNSSKETKAVFSVNIIG